MKRPKSFGTFGRGPDAWENSTLDGILVSMTSKFPAAPSLGTALPGHGLDCVMSAQVKITAATASIAPYRVHVRDIAAAQGWAVKQTSTEVDTYSKGGQTITATWGHGQLITFTGIKSAAGKLQQLVTLLGVRMTSTQLFKSADCPAAAKLPSSKVAALRVRAAKEIKIMAAATK